MEDEYVAELMSNKKEMKNIQKEMQKIMGNKAGKSTDIPTTNDEDEGEDVSVDSDMKIAAYDKQ
jgi:hypothetical protein